MKIRVLSFVLYNIVICNTFVHINNDEDMSATVT